ncbi:MAG: AAA family ATPase [Acutalibacteraceae bacterium]|nr:AAA family ATPase [Acutalibacteraceae bacterium]
MNDIELLNFNDVIPENIEWLYYPYIPSGKITILCGNPGCGKTTFALALSALLSKGAPLPLRTEPLEPINIIYQTGEDGIEDTIVPMLNKFNADNSRIASVDMVTEISFDNYVEIEKAIIKHKAKLMVFDPLQAFIGNSNLSSVNEMRNLLRKIGDIAYNTGCAILILSHLNKSTSSSNLMYRLLGSVDLVAIARSVLLITEHPQKNDTKILYQMKNNLAPHGMAVAFNILDNGINWLEYCDIHEGEILHSASSTDFQNACDMLKELLEHENVKSDRVRDLAASNGIGFTTLKKAKKYLNIKSVKIGHCWYYKKLDNVKED